MNDHKLRDYLQKELTAANNHTENGTKYFEQGDFDKAVECFTKALGIRESILGTEHPDTLELYVIMAEALDRQDNKDVDLMLNIYLKALKALDANNIRDFVTAHVCYSIGSNLYNCKYYEDASGFLDRAVEIGEEKYGAYDQNIATYYHAAALAHLQQEKYGQVEKYIGKCLAIREKCLDANDLLLAESYTVAGLAYARHDDTKEALEFFRKVLRIKAVTLGEDHEETRQARMLVEMVMAGKTKM